MSVSYKTMAVVVFSAICFLSNVAGAQDEPDLAGSQDVMMILDASGSMWGQINGEPKISIAKTVVSDLLTDWDKSINLGLMAYGHRRKGDCSDIELLSNVAPVNKAAIMSKVQVINPKGKTPISSSVRQAADILKYNEQKATVILVSDGLETCNADPCALAAELEASGVDFTAHVVGFGVTTEESTQLQCIADNTGGQYLSASSAGELTTALAETVATVKKAATSPQGLRVRTKLCEDCEIQDMFAIAVEVQNTSSNDQGETEKQAGQEMAFFELPPGIYSAEVKLGYAVANAEAQVEEDTLTNLDVNLNAGVLRPTAFMSEGGTRLSEFETSIEVFAANESGGVGERIHVSANGSTPVVLPSGGYVIRTKHGYARKETPFTITAGEDISPVAIMDSGTLTPVSVAIPGGARLTGFATMVEVFPENEDGSSGARIYVSSNGTASVVLNSGDYILRTQHGKAYKETAFTIVAEEETSPVTVMDSGTLQPIAVAEPGGAQLTGFATMVEVFPVNEDGTLASRIHVSANGASSVVLPAGDYVVRTKYGTITIDKQVTITAGEKASPTTVMQ